MTMQQMQQTALDMVSERDNYWAKASQMASRLLGDSEHTTDILADFVTKLLFNPDDTQDPLETLQTVAWDWGCDLTGCDSDDIIEYDSDDIYDNEECFQGFII